MIGFYRIDKNFLLQGGNYYASLIYVDVENYYIVNYDNVIELLNYSFNYVLTEYENARRPISENEGLMKFLQSE